MPLYRTIFETLRDEIKEGRYQEAFPSEAQLIRRFAVGRQTILRVVGDLVGAGLVERHRGSGSVVSRRVRQKLGDVGLIMPHLASSPFTSAAAEACRVAGYTLLFKELGGRNPLVPTERRVKGAFSLAMELAEKNVLGVLWEILMIYMH